MRIRIFVLPTVFAACVALARAAEQSPQQHSALRDSQPNQGADNERSGMEAAGRKWEKQGVQVGQALDDLAVFNLEGKCVKLATMWKDRPALIVTASLTCPVARERCRRLPSIIEQFDPEVRVLMLYTIEAHPKGDDSPYSPGREWVTADNEKFGVLHAQPTTLDERLTLAREMHERIGKSVPMLVDAMDNQVWQALGGAPNLAVLIDTSGTVIAKQGWFDAEGMRRSIDALLKRHVTQAGSEYEIGKQARPRMEEFIAALESGDRAAIDEFYAPEARRWRGQKTGEGAPVTADPWRDWNAELHARCTVKSARIEANKVIVEASEINDFARLIDFTGWRAATTYWFNSDGRVTEELCEPVEVKPSMRECFARALDWARQHKAEELKAIYPDNDFAPSANSAKRWREVLVEWRKATGRPTINP
jgi:hypothetical protein